MNEFEDFLATEISNSIAHLERSFKTPKQVKLAASELAISLRIVYHNMVDVICTVKDDYRPLHIILLQQTCNFKKDMNFYLPMVNRLIDFVASTHSASVCPPLCPRSSPTTVRTKYIIPGTASCDFSPSTTR